MESEVDTNESSDSSGDEPKESKPTREDPKSVEIQLSTIAVLSASILAAVLIGAGGYFFGRSTGEDLDAARSSGAVSGKKAGAAKGYALGFKKGFREGRGKGFEDAFPGAYKENYAKAFEKAGLDAPAASDIDAPKP